MKELMIAFSLFSSITAYGSCPGEDVLAKIKLPHGFKIDYFAKGITDARAMALGAKGTVFVGSTDEGKVYALVDKDGDGHSDQVHLVAKDLNAPNGVAFHKGDLYVAEINRILKFPQIEDHLTNPPESIVFNDSYPSDTHHGNKFIAFGPDNYLYVPVGAPCNVCEKTNPIYSTITRLDETGKKIEIFAHGVRDSVGFSFHPKTGNLWFTDNGRDLLGDNLPPDELNYAPQKDLHFGFPYCHGKNIKDPQFGEKKKCEEIAPPQRELGPHVAALGMRFYTGKHFPQEYHQQIFIAEHGSWNRSKKIGYRLTLVNLNGNEATDYKVFAEGWLKENGQVCGRPVDVMVMPDGALLVSDDDSGSIYRITYHP